MPKKKSKVKFTEKKSQSTRKVTDAVPVTPAPVAPTTTKEKDGTSAKRKSKKLLSTELNSEALEELYDKSSEEKRVKEVVKPPETTVPITLSDPDEDISEGSISDSEVPLVKWLLGEEEAFDGCQDLNEEENDVSMIGNMGAGQQNSQCFKSDDKPFNAAECAASAALFFTPKLMHPINCNAPINTRHREFTDYLRNSGCLRLFGTCILCVYRMKKWPPPEQLMEQMVSAMGYPNPVTRKQLEELTQLKETLTSKHKLLKKERCQLLEKLDEYQDWVLKYALQDQDEEEIPPQSPENSTLEY